MTAHHQAPRRLLGVADDLADFFGGYAIADERFVAASPVRGVPSSRRTRFDSQHTVSVEDVEMKTHRTIIRTFAV